jgi:hypothetical protein
MLYTIVHNAEFYAPGRLERDHHGKLVEHFGAGEIAAAIQANGGPVLVLVPTEYLSHLTGDSSLNARELDRNKETSIALVQSR